MIKLLGLLGGLCFAYAGVPSALSVLKAGKNIGIPVLTAQLIFGGTIFLYSYLYFSYGLDWILTLNYSVEALSWGIILYYNYFPRKGY